jgi:hypothetical protein
MRCAISRRTTDIARKRHGQSPINIPLKKRTIRWDQTAGDEMNGLKDRFGFLAESALGRHSQKSSRSAMDASTILPE